VPTDVVCKQCGYNLYTLALAGVCPECGTPVEHSLRGFLLKYASPEWVARVARGGWVLVIADVLMILAGMGVGVWSAYTALSRGATPGAVPAINTRAISTVSVIAFAPLAVLTIVGLWLFTTRNPADTVAGTESVVRRWLRGSLWLYGGSTLLGWFVGLAPDSLLSLTARSSLTALTVPLGMAIFTLMAALGLRYIGQLMARIPRPGLVRFSGICFWGVLICGILIALGQVAMAGTTAQSIAAVSAPGTAGTTTMPGGAAPPVLPPGGLALMLTACPSCAGGGFYVASFVLLIMACGALSGAAREARQTLAPPPPGSSPLGSPT
jgi:hypothetical protein